MDNSTDRVE